MTSHEVDSASFHALISALLRKDSYGWTVWERRAVAEITLDLLGSGNIIVPLPPKHPKTTYNITPVDRIYHTLGEFVIERDATVEKKKRALESTKLWVEQDINRPKIAFELLNKDPSTEVFARWAIERDWPYHVARHGSLVDEPLFDNVASIFSWSTREKKELHRQMSEPRLIALWTEKYHNTEELPPREIVDAYLMCTLLRGKYYQILATLRGGTYIWHSLRNYIIDPVVELSALTLSRDRLVESFLAGMICSGAMEERSDNEVISSWTLNIRKLRSRVFSLPQENDLEKAQSLAVEIARKSDLEFRWNRLEAILEGAFHHFVIPIIGIAAGSLSFTLSGSHVAFAISHLTAENAVAAFADPIASKIAGAVGGSPLHLKVLAKSGLKRIFAITEQDLRAIKDINASPTHEG